MSRDAVVESLWVVPGADGAGQVQSSEGRDEVWMIVKRTINGVTKRYVEVLERDFAHGHDQENAYYSDSLITYDQPLTVTDIAVTADVVAAAFAPIAVDLDGSTWLRKDTPLTGVVNSSAGMISFWMRLPALPAAWYGIFGGITNDIFDCIVGKNAGNLYVGPDLYQDATFATGISFNDQTEPQTTGVGYNVLIAWDTNHAAGARVHQIAVNDVVKTVTVNADAGGAFNVGWADDGGVLMFRDEDQVQHTFVGALAELWWSPVATLDLTVTANRRKFISATGQPVDLGTDGSTPTGTAPAVYLSARSAASEFATNRGTGGAFTLNGAFTLSSWTPGT